MHKLSETSSCFSARHDATSRIGLTLLQKFTVALHQLAYGMVTDMIDDEYLEVGK
jgi:hypothetical protein